MEEDLKPARIANAIMQNSDFHGYYLIVEGTKDYKIYSKFICNEKVLIKEAFGNMKVQEVLRILNERGFDRKIGIIDSDFNRICENEIEIEGLFLTDDHDIEVAIIKTKALNDVLRIYCTRNKIDGFAKKFSNSICEELFNLGKEVGYLRLANKIYDLGLVFKPKNSEGNQLKFKKFISETTFKYLGDKKLIKTVFDYSNNKSVNVQNKDTINEKLLIIKKKEYPICQLVNGHDLSNALFLLMKKVLNSSKTTLIDNNSVEDSLTLAYDYEDFRKTTLYSQINTWSKEREINIFRN